MTSPRPAPGRLRVVTHGTPARVWETLLREWHDDPDNRLIVASALARHRVLTRAAARQGTLLGGTVDTMERLWRDVGSRAGVPAPLDDIELRARVTEALGHDSIPPVLRAVANRPADVARLVGHLKHLDDRVGDDYPAQSPVEGGIADLRRVLNEMGVVSRARFRVLTARAAAGITYDRPLVVAPPSALRPTTGHLLMALATNAPVTLHLAASPGDADLMLAQIGITPADVDVVTVGMTDLIGVTPRLIEADDEVLATSVSGVIGVTPRLIDADDEVLATSVSGVIGVTPRLIDADDEVEVAIEIAAGWAGADTPLDDIVVCVPGGEAADAAITAAARRGLPVVAGRGAAMRDSLVGSMLERLCVTLQVADEQPGLRGDLLADLAEAPDAHALGLTADDIQTVATAHAAGAVTEAAALHAVGLRLADHAYQAAGGTPGVLGPQLHQAYLWLDALRTQIDTLRAHDVPPPARTHMILEESVAVPRPRGPTGGVAIVRPHEAAALGATHVVMTGLSAGSLPRTPPASPFTSRALLAAAPALQPRDERADFLAIRAVATGALTMVRQPEGPDGIARDPSPWFTQVQKAEGVVPEVISVRDGAAVRRRMQGRARAGIADPGPVGHALDALERHRRPPEFPGTPKPNISVTTLEEYLRCPLGWMVGRHMRPWSRGGVNLHMGNVADHALGMALTLGGTDPVDVAPLAARVAAAMAAIHPHPAWSMVPRDKRDLLEGWIESTARKYYDPDYMNEIAPGWRPVAAQMRLRSTGLVDGFTISGVADRVDVTDRGVLVIDWKLQRTIQIPDSTRRRDELQKGLYPVMAAGSPRSGLPDEILGFLYVSVAHQDHVGSTTRPVGGGGEVDQEWVADSRRAIERATAACHGIRDREVWDTGETCDAPWCGHQYISTTAWSTR